MSASVVQITTKADILVGTGTTYSPSASFTTVTAGDALVVWFTHDYSGGEPTLTCADSAGGTWSSALDTAKDATDTQKMVMFVCKNHPGGSSVLPTVTSSSSVPGRAIRCIQVTGVDTAALGAGEHAGQHQATPGTGTDGVTSGNVTPTASASLLLAHSFNSKASAAAPAAGTGFTNQTTCWPVSGGDEARSESKALSGTSAVAGTFTASGDENHLTIAVVLDEPAAGGATGRFFFAAGF